MNELPRELEFKQMMQELAATKVRLADLGEELIETKKELEKYKTRFNEVVMAQIQ